MSPTHSAHSRSSSRASSADSSHSNGSTGRLNGAMVQHASSLTEATAGATYCGPTKTVDMLLVVGGMDTEGEIFDDCLVFLIKDHGPDEDQETAGAACGDSGELL